MHSFHRAILSCCCILPMTGAADQIYVFAGQSNMCGYGAEERDLASLGIAVNQNAMIQCMYARPIPGVWTTPVAPWMPAESVWYPYVTYRAPQYYYDGPNPGDPWTTMGGPDGVNRKFGPELMASRTIQTATGMNVYIVKYAIGGSSLQNDWKSNGAYYNAMKYWANKAVANRPGSVIAGFFWMQGEADATTADASSAYQANLTALVARVRSDFGDPTLPFVLGRISNVVKYGGVNAPFIAPVRQAQANVAASVSNVRMVDTDNLPLISDQLHFSTSAILTLGTRMGDAWLSMTSSTRNQSPTANPITATTLEDTAQSIVLSASDGDGTIVSYVCQQPAHGTVSGSGPAVTYTPMADFNGTDSFAYAAIDNHGGSSAPATVTITVAAVNDAPVFTKGPHQAVGVGSAAVSIPGWASGIRPGPANESLQICVFSTTNDNNAIFSAQPRVDSDGSLHFTPAAAAVEGEVATVTVRLSDDGSTANGGIDTSATQTFTITLGSVSNTVVGSSAESSGTTGAGCGAGNGMAVILLSIGMMYAKAFRRSRSSAGQR